MNSDEVQVVLTDSADDDTEYPNDIICREFKLTLISAQNLPEVRKVFDSRVLAKVTIGGDESTEKETEADEENGLNPVWNTYVRYNLSESSITQNTATAVVKLYSQRTLGDKYIGQVNMSVKWLFQSWSKSGSTIVDYPINQHGAETSAVLKVCCSFGERFLVKKPSVWKNVLVQGANLLFNLTLQATIGSD